MTLNPTKTILQPVSHGVDFVGRIIKPWHTIPRGKLVVSGEKLIKSGEATAERLTCYLGLLRQSQARRVREDLCRSALKAGFSVDHRLTKVFPRKVVPTQ